MLTIVVLAIIAIAVVALCFCLFWKFCGGPADSDERTDARYDPTSRDAGLTLVDELEESNAHRQIALLQENLKDQDEDERSRRIVKAQGLLLQVSNKSLATAECHLIIGVDATPATQAGYCVNLKTKTLSYYAVKTKDLPWLLHNADDPSEFEMKNFMFALTVWNDDIVNWNKVCIYTDNFAITRGNIDFDTNLYGERAFSVLSHLITCKGVTVLNIQKLAVNKFKNLVGFAKYIRPADDLSRWRIKEAVTFLRNMYGIRIENVTGTHLQNLRQLQRGNTNYEPTDQYETILNFARTSITSDRCTNPRCPRANLLQASLRRS